MKLYSGSTVATYPEGISATLIRALGIKAADVPTLIPAIRAAIDLAGIIATDKGGTRYDRPRLELDDLEPPHFRPPESQIISAITTT